MRQIAASDTFDASIGASWDNGLADWGTLSWITGGHIQPTALGECSMRWNAGSWARKQWATAKVHDLNTTGSVAHGVQLLSVGGATDESCYTGFIIASAAGSRYGVAEWNSAFGETVLSLTGDGSTPAFVAGDTVTLESDGAGNLTLFVCEANVNNGIERAIVTVTDTTITTGNPGIYFYQGGSLTDLMTAWAAGNLLSSWPEVCQHRPHQYHRAHNQS